MHNWAEIRRRVLVEGLSQRAACREFDLHWSTLEKILGLDELMDSGLKYWQIMLELAARAVDKVGVTKAVVPPTFPLALAEHLREKGVELTVERDLFVDRRRVKNDTEIAGIKRAEPQAHDFSQIQSLTVDGQPAKAIDYLSLPDKHRLLHQYQVFVAKSGMIYTITYSALPSAYSDNLASVKQVTDGWHWLS